MVKKIEDSRSQFEREFKRQYCNVPASEIKNMLELYNRGTEKSPIWDYRSMVAQNLWEWWQDSRAAIVVELPQRQSPCASNYGEGLYLFPSESGECLEYDETVEALRAAGLSIKGE